MTETDRIEFYKVRDFSEILNVTFAFLRENFKKFLKAFVFIAGPFLLLQTIVQVYIYSKFFENITFGGGLNLSFFLNFLSIYPFMILTITVIELVTYKYIILYGKYGRDGFDINTLWIECRKDFWRMLGLTILTGIIVVFSALFFLIPGVYFAVALSISGFVLLQENTGVFESISRSISLIKNYWWFTCGILVIVYIIQVMLSYAISFPAMILSFIMGFHNMEASENFSSLMSIISIISTIAQNISYFIYTFGMIAIAFIYFTLIERKEAKGLENRLDQMISDQTEPDQNV